MEILLSKHCIFYYYHVFQDEVQVGPNVSGHLCIKKPWPGQARTIWGNHKKFLSVYYETHPGKSFVVVLGL